jgi:hypothetical protein
VCRPIREARIFDDKAGAGNLTVFAVGPLGLGASSVPRRPEGQEGGAGLLLPGNPPLIERAIDFLAAPHDHANAGSTRGV